MARELQSVMRQAQVRAVTEGRAICVSFRVAQNDYTVYRGPCGGTTETVLGPVVSESAEVRLSAPRSLAPRA